METAAQLISRTPPQLTQVNGTTRASMSGETVSLQFLQEWINFEQDVLQACSTLNLSQPVPLTDDRSEDFLVGSELGLTGRFSKHICDAVTKALSITNLSNLKFGDYQVLEPTERNKSVPDVIMVDSINSTVVVVGELESFWTVQLERYPINEGTLLMTPIQGHLGN